MLAEPEYQETMVGARLLNRAERRARKDGVVAVPLEPRVQVVYVVGRAEGLMPTKDPTTKAELVGLASVERAYRRHKAALELFEKGATHAIIDVVGQQAPHVLDLSEVVAAEIDWDAARASVRQQASAKRLKSSGIELPYGHVPVERLSRDEIEARQRRRGGDDRPQIVVVP